MNIKLVLILNLIPSIDLLDFIDLYLRVQSNYFLKMVSHSKKHQQKKQLSQVKKTSNDFAISNNTNADVIGDDTSETQTNQLKNFEWFAVGEISTCQNQVLYNNIDNAIRRAVDSAVITVKKQIHDAILTAMDSVLIP